MGASDRLDRQLCPALAPTPLFTLCFARAHLSFSTELRGTSFMNYQGLSLYYAKY